MQLWFTTLMFLILQSIGARADMCPRLEGTFHCRARQPFDIRVENNFQNGVAVYEMTDPTGTRNFLTDGRFHEMEFQNGKGQYRAICLEDHLMVEAHSPEGEILSDQYYIERSALVRIRKSANQRPSALSCAPTHGTWNLYPRN